VVFIAALMFVLGALRAGHILITGGPAYWFWGFLGFAAWVLAGVLPVGIPRRSRPPSEA
jgi:hypothetical protein